MELDYQISEIRWRNNKVEVFVNVYTGDTTTELEWTYDENTDDVEAEVTRFRKQNLVTQLSFHRYRKQIIEDLIQFGFTDIVDGLVGASVERKRKVVRKYINERVYRYILQEATKRGLTLHAKRY